jgi:adenosylhomocysteinase
MDYHIADISMAKKGGLRIEWASHSMPVLNMIRNLYRKQRPLKGIRIGACLHITTETAVLAMTLRDGGADLRLCASNPLSTQDDVAAYLVKEEGIPVFAIRGEDTQTYYRHINSVLDGKPQVTMDDGADLVSQIHIKRKELANGILGGTEETTTGVLRLRSMSKKGILMFPIIAVNDAMTKHLFDNRYGTGQSTIDGIVRATNRLLAGTVFVVCGYGWCGRGVAMRASGMGANVVVTEVDPLRAMEAVMDGYRVMPMREACKIGDIFCTLTGDVKVIRKGHFLKMKDGAIVANSGHFNVEIDLEGLKEISKKKRKIRENVEEFTLKNGKRVNLLAEGRLVNLASAEGHPPSVMDMSFANQALCIRYIVESEGKLKNTVYPVPEEIDREVARLKLKSMGIEIDRLTKDQERYLSSWELGT